MAVYQLENEHIYLEVASHGAELVRLVGKKTKKEYLFDGDPKYWKRHSPILFPFVGGVKNKEYRYNGKTYTMTQHGFARDMEFTLDSQTQDTLWFSIVSNETTMENYPFAFRLEVGYQLKGTEVIVLWNVINTDTKEMYFSIGAHPAFFASMTLEDGPDTDHIHVGDNIEEHLPAIVLQKMQWHLWMIRLYCRVTCRLQLICFQEMLLFQRMIRHHVWHWLIRMDRSM